MYKLYIWQWAWGVGPHHVGGQGALRPGDLLWMPYFNSVIFFGFKQQPCLVFCTILLWSKQLEKVAKTDKKSGLSWQDIIYVKFQLQWDSVLFALLETFLNNKKLLLLYKLFVLIWNILIVIVIILLLFVLK